MAAVELGPPDGAGPFVFLPSFAVNCGLVGYLDLPDLKINQEIKICINLYPL